MFRGLNEDHRQLRIIAVEIIRQHAVFGADDQSHVFVGFVVIVAGDGVSRQGAVELDGEDRVGQLVAGSVGDLGVAAAQGNEIIAGGERGDRRRERDQISFRVEGEGNVGEGLAVPSDRDGLGRDGRVVERIIAQLDFDAIAQADANFAQVVVSIVRAVVFREGERGHRRIDVDKVEVDGKLRAIFRRRAFAGIEPLAVRIVDVGQQEAVIAARVVDPTLHEIQAFDGQRNRQRPQLGARQRAENHFAGVNRVAQARVFPGVVGIGAVPGHLRFHPGRLYLEQMKAGGDRDVGDVDAERNFVDRRRCWNARQIPLDQRPGGLAGRTLFGVGPQR